MAYKLGSLFDGSGGFPLAGSLCGIEPVWASEVEPYPIAVTRSRFPNMKHLGDISKVNGGRIEPVDIITFGSPCQDLSVAGKRAGLKHEANGDEETTRSGLFMEAVRIIKEMREATNGEYPSFALWENVPGAFSSNKGEDFRLVCEELIKIVEPGASMPAVPKKGWPYADSYCGDGWSLAYRVFDAQYWGVPQRRRRIHLVVDLRGERARQVSFEREGVRGDFETGRTPWQILAAHAQDCAGADDREGERAGKGGLDAVGCDLYNIAVSGDVAVSLTANTGTSCTHSGPTVAIPYTLKIRSGCEGGGKGALVQENKSATLATNNDQYRFQPVDDLVYCLQGDGIDRADTAGCNGKGWREDVSYILNTLDRPAVAYLASGKEAVGTLMASMATKQCLGDQEAQSGDYHIIEERPIVFDKEVYNSGKNATGGHYMVEGGPAPTLRGTGHTPGVCVHYIVRRLTPTECARLQGFPDTWGHPDIKESLTPDEFQFWQEVRNTHATINGKKVMEYTEAQMLRWYNKLHTDSAEYKMWGNGIALPPALYILQGMVDALDAAGTEDS